MSVRLLGLILPAFEEIPLEEWSNQDFFSSSSDFNEYDFWIIISFWTYLEGVFQVGL